MFSISASDGEIRTIRALDYEAARSHNLMVTASDSAPDQRSTTVNVTIYVTDTEDVLPVFPTKQYVANVPENAVDYTVATVEVGPFKFKKINFGN